jgi:hypothetical protein
MSNKNWEYKSEWHINEWPWYHPFRGLHDYYGDRRYSTAPWPYMVEKHRDAVIKILKRDKISQEEMHFLFEIYESFSRKYNLVLDWKMFCNILNSIVMHSKMIRRDMIYSGFYYTPLHRLKRNEAPFEIALKY